MSSRQIQIVVGLLIVIAIGFGLVTVASNNREKLAAQMEAERVAALADAEKSAAEAEAVAAKEGSRPSFDVARFEPTGDGVLAGLAKPGALIELLANGEMIASEKANDVGEWVIVLDKPLKPGSYDLSLKATLSDAETTLSEEFIAVVIPDKPSGDVLVVASRPGQASEILSRPEADAKPADGTQVAAADVKQAPDSGTKPVAAETQAQSESGTSAENVQVADVMPDKKPMENAVAAETNTVNGDTAETLPAEDDKIAMADIARPDSATPAESANAEVSAQTDPVEKQAAGETTEIAATGKPETNAGQPENGSAGATTSAAETAETVTAGIAPAGQATETDEPRTVAETASGNVAGAVEADLPTATSRVDAEAAIRTELASNSANASGSGSAAESAQDVSVADKADKPEDTAPETVEKPTGTEIATIAPDVAPETPKVTATETQTAKAEDIVKPQPQEQPVVEKPKPVVPLALDAVETEGEMVYAAGTGNAGKTVRVYVDDAYIGETVTDDSGRWLLETPASIAAGNVVVRADEMETGNADVVRRAEVPFLKQADAIALLPTSATAGGGASGASSAKAVAAPKSVIIRSGDNLWTISRRTYGRGIRYTTIYMANDDQIRNPHMIFPGQVFVLPEGDKTWTQ